MLRDAFLLALKGHENQMYGDKPYVAHLYDVVNVLLEFGISDEELLSAAWLHDIIEDAPYNFNDVSRVTSERVAEIVFAVTDEMGRNRKERKEKTLPKLVGFDDAITLKLADWIANVRNCHKENPKLLQMYKKDWNSFSKFRNKDYKVPTLMWNELEKLLK